MTTLDQLARRVLRMERRLDSRNHTQLAHQSIEDGAIQAYVSDQLTLIMGRQHDGTNGAFGVAGPVPYPCTAPSAHPIQGGVTIVWDGEFPDREDDEGVTQPVYTPMDFSHVDIVISLTASPDWMAIPPSASISTARGGSQFVTLAPLTTYYCALIVWTQSGKFSPPSQVTSFTTHNDSDGDGEDILEAAEEYADEHDVLTLEAAKDYTDSHSAHVFEYDMPIAQTTTTVDHDLGRDPVGVQVLVDGQVAVPTYSISFPIPGEQVLIGFDVSVAAKIRLF